MSLTSSPSQRHREGGERTDDRVARREGLGVPVHLERSRRSRSPPPPRGGGAGAPGTPSAAPRSTGTDPRPTTGRRRSRSSASRSTRLSLSCRVLRTRTAMLSNCLASVSPVWQGMAVTPASSPRRIGAEDSKTRAQLLDAAELLLLEEGYAAVTSRRVAAKAGLKPQLVHYYFRTMDDLFLEVFRRRAEENVARVERAIAADGSLRVAVAAQRRPPWGQVQHRVRGPGQSPQGHPHRDRPLRRAVPGRPARGGDHGIGVRSA